MAFEALSLTCRCVSAVWPLPVFVLLSSLILSACIAARRQLRHVVFGPCMFNLPTMRRHRPAGFPGMAAKLLKPLKGVSYLSRLR